MRKVGDYVEDEVQKIIEQTVNMTILKLKMSGLLREGGRTAAEKTEDLLYNYPAFKEVDEDGARTIVERVEHALRLIENDPYYDIIPMTYFKRMSREDVAYYLNASPTTVTRNRRRLIDEMKPVIVSEDTILELLL
jgi:DNA-directed RNA polymerase specialized sigma subunit